MSAEYRTREIRATGRTPEAVSVELQAMLNEESADGWTLDRIQPIIYNSSTTGYLIVIFTRPSARVDAS
jgi:hypothetical protein